MTDIAIAKRLIALSQEGARLLGMGVSRPCFQGRYNAAAQAALADPEANLTAEERRLIASFVEPEQGDAPRSFMLRVRLTESERDRIQQLADEAGMDMSEYVRTRVLE